MALTYNEIKQKIYKNTKANSSSYSASDLCLDVNQALSSVLARAFIAGGKWQPDDINHTDAPTIYTSLVSGQKDYSFTEDEQGNMILDIYRVFVKDTSGVYQEVYPVDMQADPATQSFTDEQTQYGVPRTYDKTGNSITFDVTPHSSVYTDAGTLTRGIKVMINREGSFFTTSDTTKVAGIDPRVQDYLWVAPSLEYATINNLKNINFLLRERERLENLIDVIYAKRERDNNAVITAKDKNEINYI